MKKTIYIVTAMAMLVFFACKQVTKKNVTVIKDCTGTYLRLENKDYHVCNIEKLASFADSAQVKATFTKIRDCNGSAKDLIVCEMYHKNEGWITVEKIE